MTIAGAAAMAIGAVVSWRERAISTLALTAGQLLVATVALVPLAALVDQPWRDSGLVDAAPAIGAAVVIGTAAPLMLLFWLIRTFGPTRASLVPLMMPVAAVVIGAVELGELLPLLAYGGLAVILVAAIAMNRDTGAPCPAPLSLTTQEQRP